MKRRKLLIGYDGSPSSIAALAGLERAGLPVQGEARVLCAVDVFVPSHRDRSVPDEIRPVIRRARAFARKQVRRAAQSARRGARRMKALFPKWTVSHDVRADSPAWALLSEAESWRPDLLLVGAGGHSPVGRFLGSVSQMVVSQAACSVRVGRPPVSTGDRRFRVLIAFDGSPDSVAAVEAAAARAWPRDTEFRVITVIDPRKSTIVHRLAPAVIRWFLDQADDERTILGRLLETQAGRLRKAGYAVTCAVERGNPVRTLLQQSTAWRAGVIFVGARGLSHLRRMMMGGVSTAVATRAPCSVEVVRR
jgi:nucleotide-binding universal stress UspA family protein